MRVRDPDARDPGQQNKAPKVLRKTHTHTHKSLSRVRLFATPWIVAHQAPRSMGYSRHEYWSGLPFPSPRKTKRTYKNTTTVGDFNAPLPELGILNKQKISKNGENLSDQNNYLFLTFTECFTFFVWLVFIRMFYF